MSSLEPQLWVADPVAAIDFYVDAFGATELYRVGLGHDIVAQLAIGDARFWVSNSGGSRFDPRAIGGTTSRTLLLTTEPADVVIKAAAAGAEVVTDVTDEHGWRLGRIVDPFGHEWEIGHPVGDWPP